MKGTAQKWQNPDIDLLSWVGSVGADESVMFNWPVSLDSSAYCRIFIVFDVQGMYVQ
jgi:hypothetical protein